MYDVVIKHFYILYSMQTYKILAVFLVHALAPCNLFILYLVEFCLLISFNHFASTPSLFTHVTTFAFYLFYLFIYFIFLFLHTRESIQYLSFSV